MERARKTRHEDACHGVRWNKVAPGSFSRDGRRTCWGTRVANQVLDGPGEKDRNPTETGLGF